MADLDAALRDFVRSRANGFCEYCRISDQLTLAEHQVDHVIAVKHGGHSASENLALCCTICNRFKGSDIASIDPETGQTVGLFHPRRDRWEDHFHIVRGLITPATAVGRVTARLLRMNAVERIAEREILQAIGRYPAA